FSRDWSSDVCSSDLVGRVDAVERADVSSRTSCLVLREAGAEPGHAVYDVHRLVALLDGVAAADAHVDRAAGQAVGLADFQPRYRSEERRVGKEWRTG